jgi:hypothetical protein
MEMQLRATVTPSPTGPRPGQAGFALIVALLALVMLTLLGMTMSLTTSTELSIATNYRWGQQALYNAEAGIEIGKRYLRQVDWGTRTVLPDPRFTVTPTSAPPAPPFPLRTGPHGEANRSFENEACDNVGAQGFGIVLDDPTYAFPYQNMTSFLLDGASNQLGVAGAFTLWVRRPLLADNNGAVADDPGNNALVLTAEGVAPFRGAGTGAGDAAFRQRNRAVRYLEVTLQRIVPGDCENRSGQAGAGPTGSGYDQCDTINPSTILGGVTEPTPSAR